MTTKGKQAVLLFAFIFFLFPGGIRDTFKRISGFEDWLAHASIQARVWHPGLP
jgi:hypothetical protein